MASIVTTQPSRSKAFTSFGIAFISLLYPLSTLWGSILLTIGVLIGLELFIESIGLLGALIQLQEQDLKNSVRIDCVNTHWL